MDTYIFYNDELYHHGMKGMRWGVRHDPRAAEVRDNYRHLKNAKRDYKRTKQRYKAAKNDMRSAKRAYRMERRAYKNSVSNYKALIKNTDTSVQDIPRKHSSAIATGKRYVSSVKKTMSTKVSEIRERRNNVNYIEDE